MSRRSSPRPAAGAFREALEGAAPRTGLAAVQSVWLEVVGDRVAAVAQPVSEQGGEVTIACTDAVWAEELDLMQAQLAAGLRERLGEAAPRGLRFSVRNA